MGKTYQLASEVVVWLGLEKDNSNSAINFITSSVDIRGRSFFLDLLASADHAPPFQAILNLTQRDYWHRAWIIQEVFQARKITIHCGFDALPWPQFAKFFRLMAERVDLFESVRTVKEICNTTAHRLTKDRTLKNRDLYHLLHRYQDSMCSDPRDRVFSLCGMSKAYVGFVNYTKSPEDLFGLLCGFDNNGPMVWHRVRIAQAIQKSLNLSTWETWVREANFDRISDSSLICRYSHHNVVSNTSPEFPVEEQTLSQWYAQFQGPNMPSLESVKKALGELTVYDLRLFDMTETSGHGLDPGMQTELWADSLDLRQRLYSPGLPTPFKGLHLFTTHNGRVGITLRPLFKPFGRETCIARFADCDVAWVKTNGIPYVGGISSRVFFIKDANDDLVPGHSAYRFAIPNSRDTHQASSSIRNADVGEGRRVEVDMRETDAFGTIWCTLGLLQFFTAARAPSEKYWVAKKYH